MVIMLLFVACIILYLLCCRCILIYNYNEINEKNARAIQEAIEKNRLRELELEIKRQEELVQELKDSYKLKYKETMEYDDDYVIIVNPNKEQLSLGKKITN